MICRLPARPRLMALLSLLAPAPLLLLAAAAQAAAPPPTLSAAPVVDRIVEARVDAPSGGGAGALASEDDYQLGVADKVRVIVFNEQTLSGEFVVNANGALSLPLVGEVTARGLTPSQLTAAITDKLRNGYILSPSVSIEVLTFRPFYILGEVKKPGEYPYSSGLTVDAAVAMAEGYTYRANKKVVFVRHFGEETAEKVTITPGLKVRPGDIIKIGERYW